MNISLAFSDFPAPGHPFRIWCFLACGYLAPDGSFTNSKNDAKVFSAEDFISAFEFADQHIRNYFFSLLDSFPLTGVVDAQINISFEVIS